MFVKAIALMIGLGAGVSAPTLYKTDSTAGVPSERHLLTIGKRADKLFEELEKEDMEHSGAMPMALN